MLIKKFYCHKCGERLVRNPRTITIRRGDPDYRKHSHIGDTHMIGDVELTEYDFKCPSCDKITVYDEQCIVEKIQKNIGKRILSQAEISEYAQKAEADLKRKRRITDIIIKTIFVALIVLAIYLYFKSGDFSLEFYF